MNYVITLTPKEKLRQKTTSISLGIWFGMEIYCSLMEGALGSSTKITVLRYSLYLMLSFWILYKRKGLFKKKLGVFLAGCLCTVAVNFILVTWKKYVLVESLTALIMAFPAFLAVSDRSFDIKNCVEDWYPFCVFHTMLLILVLYLYKINSVTYGAISTITYSNIIILWFLYIKHIKRNWFNLVLLLTNNIVGIIWGSRMPALAAIITMFYMWLLMSGKTKRSKILWTIATGLCTCFFLFFISDIVKAAVDLLKGLHLSSRSIEKLFYDLQNKTNVISMMSSSGREYIWETVSSFLRRNFILPHGFGFVRQLTGGKYYYSHNIFFDFLIMGGIFSTIFILIFVKKLYEFKKRETQISWDFLQSILVFFLIRSFTGAYFISDKYSVLAIALIFFVKNKECDEND